jgi:hypothetical protein
VRFALAASLPPLLVLSLAATARNIYLAPALPGFALLVGWWAREIRPGPDSWDVRALRATAAMLLLGVAVFAAVLAVLAADAGSMMPGPAIYVAVSLAGLSAAAILAIRAWAAAREHAVHAQWALLLAYCALLIGPASQVYRRVDAWQDLAKIGRAVERDTAGRPLILLAPDETTRAIIDMYARPSVERIAGPLDAAGIDRIRSAAAAAPMSLFLVQLPSQSPQLPWRKRLPQADLPPAWEAAKIQMAKSYSLPNGRRYALLQVTP